MQGGGASHVVLRGGGGQEGKPRLLLAPLCCRVWGLGRSPGRVGGKGPLGLGEPRRACGPVVPVLLGPGQRSRTQWSQLVDNEAKWSVSSQG